jgi:hypothetical protein
MTSLSIHGVRKIIVEDTKEQFSGSFVRGITIFTEQGEEIEIVMFTRRGPGALEPVSEAMEDWK